jgi:uncharacterized membrane protein YeaQ/YmgE (transglycosylase-associated protein family)
MPTDLTLHVNLWEIFIWIVVGLVAGLIASRIMLGHGLGLLGDIAIGVVGAIVGNILAAYFGVQVAVAGHPFISDILVAFVGAIILLGILRITSVGRRRSAI